ncbi:uncharacterized protein LOC105164710 isoform X1 [Sesamum indicum]|uniref:Uncharacterized protein LOC105164710 isoform X1 n=1 Tax=Sesamum indicum TaxID=4182 RepID=A0A8M8V1C2_SESIN|nr:uncharacterized protein LOC105164710 isoform X1 [Sesamum indicum]
MPLKLFFPELKEVAFVRLLANPRYLVKLEGDTWIDPKHEILQVFVLMLPNHYTQWAILQLWKIDEKDLHVGEELLKETLPLQNGARLYQLRGLRPHMWYEVKISYPASIPASFSLQLNRGSADLGLNLGRKLLNTEKIIFMTDGMLLSTDQGGMSMLVNVKPEGVVAIPGLQERDYIMFNIVCDELLLGIPHKAWYVVILALGCLVLAFVVPSFLPPFLLPKNGNSPFSDQAVTKDS